MLRPGRIHSSLCLPQIQRLHPDRLARALLPPALWWGCPCRHWRGPYAPPKQLLSAAGHMAYVPAEMWQLGAAPQALYLWC